MLQLMEGPPPPALVPPAPVEVRLPGGALVTAVERDEAKGEDGSAHVVALRVESAELGTVELRIALDEQLVHARVALAEGPALEHARQGSGALRLALGAAAGRSAEVDVVARPNPLDVYV